MRTTSKTNCRAQSLSRDGGKTWTAPEYSPELVEPRVPGEHLALQLPNGKEAGAFSFPTRRALAATT